MEIDIGRAIMSRRKARGWSQAELGAQLGTSHATIARWEGG